MATLLFRAQGLGSWLMRNLNGNATPEMCSLTWCLVYRELSILEPDQKKEETLTYIALLKHLTTDPEKTVPDAQARWAVPKWPRLLGIELVLDSHQDSFPSLLPLHPASDAPRLGTQSSRSSCQTMEGPESSLSTGIQITDKG